MSRRYRTASGATLVEGALVLMILVPLVLVVVDVARVAWIKTAVRASLVQALKQAEGDRQLQVDLWKNRNFWTARRFYLGRYRVFRSGDVSKFNGLFRGVRFKAVRHNEIAWPSWMSIYESYQPGTTGPFDVAFLPPGQSADVADWNLRVYNPHKCRAEDAAAPTPTYSTGDVHTSCTPDMYVNSSDDRQIMRQLTARFPTSVAAFFEVDTAFFGTKKIAIQVKGFPAPETKFEARPTATPAAAATASGCVIPDNVVQEKALHPTGVTYCTPITSNLFLSELAACLPGGASFRGYFPGRCPPSTAGTNAYFETMLDGVTVDDTRACWQATDDTVSGDAHGAAYAWDCKQVCGPGYEKHCVREVVGCFHPDTALTTSDGSSKRADDVREGDVLKSPGPGGFVRVLAVIKGPEKRPLVRVEAGGRSLVVTETHPVVTSRGFVRAVDLTPADSVTGGDGRPRRITALRRVPAAGVRVVNFRVKPLGPGSVGRGGAGRSHFTVEAEGLASGTLEIQKLVERRARVRRAASRRRVPA